PAFMHNTHKSESNYLVRADYYPQNARNEASVQDVANFMVKEMEGNQFLHKRVGIASPLE
ncbi:MAG: hypothetical protein AAGM67_07130, partial [Bacteroidota bacterium]